MIRYTFSFAGAGKVAGILCRELHRRGHKIEKIVSLHRENGGRLAMSCGAEWSSEPVFAESSEIIIVSVPDHSLENVLHSIKCGKESLVAHTAGSYGLDVFPATIANRGVFYPLQTFSPGRLKDFREVPVFIEGSGEAEEMRLASIAESLGSPHFITDTEKRRLLHLAAVFVCNFTNYMLVSGKQVSDLAGVDFSLLEPLIRETVNKAVESGPEESQTGPALRYDVNTIEKHLDLLSFSPELAKLYKEISGSIMDYFKREGQ